MRLLSLNDLRESRARVVRLLMPILLCAAISSQVAHGAEQNGTFSYEMLRARARALAAAEYQPDTKPPLPEPLKKLNYDEYQAIHFVPSQAPWQKEGLRFSFQFFHRGFLYRDPVRIHLLEHGRTEDFTFSPRQFLYPTNQPSADFPADLGFAGLRVLYPVNSPGKQDEVASFLGASYFRLIGAHQRYGASARGLAINTAEPTGEEFPRFTEFWLDKPGALDVSVRLYALLDGPSAAGAYQFVIAPGDITQVEVEATIFLRKDVKKLGVAALTSMFVSGENRTRLLPDFRPEVHDSDGLLFRTAGPDWFWRPLINPDKQHVVTPASAAKMNGFGLLQRDRQFDHYQDLVARYELRPSLWVEPQGDWGAGTIELVEIPSPVEYNDNMVAYWVPGTKSAKGQEFHWTYRLSASLGEAEKTQLLRVESTRIAPAHEKVPTRFVIDFKDQSTNSLRADAPVETAVHSSNGTIRNVVTEKNEVTGGWRTFFDLADPGNKPVDLRVYLHQGSELLSETWLYRYQNP